MTNNILIYNSGGGLGDAIQLIPLILSLKNHFKQSEFYQIITENDFQISDSISSCLEQSMLET